MPWKLTNRFELLSSHWLKRSNGDALPLSYVSIIQKCLHPLIVFEFCYSLHLCITSRRVTKKYYAITKEERSSPIIVKFAVIKLRGGFKPRFCHMRSVVCPSWFSASNVTRLHCYITMLNVRVKRAATLMTSFLLNHRDNANIGNCPRKWLARYLIYIFA